MKAVPQQLAAGEKHAPKHKAVEQLRRDATRDWGLDWSHEESVQRFRQDLREIAGANDLMASLKIPFAVATNGPREKASRTLSLTGLDRWLEGRVFCAPEVGSYKPEPGLFLHAAHALGCAPTQCALVEDSLPEAVAQRLAQHRAAVSIRESPMPFRCFPH